MVLFHINNYTAAKIVTPHSPPLPLYHKLVLKDSNLRGVVIVDTRQIFGRRKIYTDEEYITAENVVDVLRKAQLLHSQNQNEIQYLWNYYRGKTPILGKTKEVRESINHKICVNHANEIVTFKRGYGFGEPIQYIRMPSYTAICHRHKMNCGWEYPKKSQVNRAYLRIRLHRLEF